jgi:hypothetical protein
MSDQRPARPGQGLLLSLAAPGVQHFGRSRMTLP